MPLVSVILPNYNYARYLKECVRSVLGQTMADLELIYVDDGSTDGSNDLMAPFATDPRVSLRLFQENSGTVYRRWNEAAAEATGEWLWFPNADDCAHRCFLERVLARVGHDPRVGMAHARLAIMDQLGRLVSDRLHGEREMMEQLSADYTSEGHKEAVFLTGGRFLLTTSSVLFRRDVFLNAGGFDDRLWGSADYDLYFRLLHKCNIAYVAAPLVYYRQHGSNTTRTTQSLLLDLGFAYALAQALDRMEGDPRYTGAMRQTVLTRLRVRVFDITTNPDARIPKEWDFAAKAVYRYVPDRRLLLQAPAA